MKQPIIHLEKGDPVARVRSLFGSEGGLNLSLRPNFPDRFGAGDHLFALIDGLPVPLFAGSFEPYGTAGAHVQFDDFDTQARATELVGMDLYIDSCEQQDDEFYLEDLVGFGCLVVEASEKGVKQWQGRVADFYDNPANPLFGISIEGRKGEMLVPAADEFLARIDFENRNLTLLVPQGLIDL